jgi:hypothetical protein
MIKLLIASAALLALSGCATYAAGEDMYGRKLQGEGEQVLAAFRTAMDESGHVPKSLQELVPTYLPALPKEPNIIYTPKTGSLDFEYDQGDKGGLHVHCHALVGQLQWVCY